MFFIECKNGHPFVVTEVSYCLFYSKTIFFVQCGNPTQLETCPTCGEPIGGQRHKLTKGNVEYKG